MIHVPRVLTSFIAWKLVLVGSATMRVKTLPLFEIALVLVRLYHVRLQRACHDTLPWLISISLGGITHEQSESIEG